MEPKDKVTTILDQVSELTESEKLVLYLKLSDVTDESSRDPPTQMSERSNVALSWIKTHYVEDSDMFVPKQDVYEQYRQHCESAGNNPLSSGDFGKVMKLVFPHVHHRRLGQRGQSKYFYKGLKKQENIDTSSPTEVLSDVRTKLDLNLLALSCQLVCEWAMQLLGRPFVDIRNLSEYLVSKGLSCGKTAAKFSLLSGSTSHAGVLGNEQADRLAGSAQLGGLLMHDKADVVKTLWEHENSLEEQGDYHGPPKLFDRDRKSPNSKHHDRQILLQRKLQHNELIREHKEKLKQQQKQLREQHSSSASLGRPSLTPDACSMKGAERIPALIPGVPGRKILPRPLSVQPYVHNASSFVNKKQDVISFTQGRCFDKASDLQLSTAVSGVNTTQVTSGSQAFATGADHFPGPTSLMDMRESNSGRLPKRCHSTSVVERQSSSLLFGLLEPTEQTLEQSQRLVHGHSHCDMDDDKVAGFSSPADHSSTPTEVHAISSSSSSSEAVSRGMSSSLAQPLSNTQRNIARIFEWSGLRVSTDGLLMPQHPKRYGDIISPDRSSLTKRKCTTSLGVTNPQHLTSMGPHEHSDTDIHRSRPYSCPVSTDNFPFDSFGKEGKSLSHNVFAEIVHTRETGMSKVKPTEGVSRAGVANICTLLPDKKMKDDKKKITRTEQPKKSTSLCHFVQKPTVINRPQQLLHPVSSCSDLKLESSGSDLTPAPQEHSTEKQSYNILNSLLSSNYDTMSEPLSSLRTLPTLPLTSALTSSFICTSTTALASNASLPGSQLRLATNTSHTIESPSILSSLSSRSAFVPVTSHKLQAAHSNFRENDSVMRVPSLQKQLSELIPKEQESLVPSTAVVPQSLVSLSNDNTQALVKPAISHTPTSKSSSNPATNDFSLIQNAADTASVTFSNYGTTTTSNSSSSSSSSSTLCRSGESMSSECDSVLTTPVPAAAAAASEKCDDPLLVPFSAVSVKNIPTSGSLVCSPVLQEKSSFQCTTHVVPSDSCQTGHSFQTHTTSPITPTKRAGRNRFTPIRPKLQGSSSALSPQKLGGATTASPQKKDMRSVSTILKEQRMKCAQDLLVNLANSYQGDVKLQLPAELLGLSSGGKTKSADVCVTLRSPRSSVNILQPKLAQLVSSDLNRQLWPLTPLPPPHKEITVVVEPVSQSPVHSTLSPALSSCLISSTPMQRLQNLQPPSGVQVITHNTVQPKPLLSPTTTAQAQLGVQVITHNTVQPKPLLSPTTTAQAQLGVQVITHNTVQPKPLLSPTTTAQAQLGVQVITHNTVQPKPLLSPTTTAQAQLGVQVITHNTVQPKPLFSPTATAQAQLGVQVITHNTVQPLLSPAMTAAAQSSHQTPVCLPSVGSGTKVVMLPRSVPGLPSAQAVETNPHQPIIVEDDRGNKYSIDQKSVPTILPQNLQNFLDNQVVDSVEASSSESTSYIGGSSHLLNVADMNARVIGPDSNGQTYLLVPNSESLPTITTPGFLCHQTSPTVDTAFTGTATRSQNSTSSGSQNSISSGSQNSTSSESQNSTSSGASAPPVMIQPAAASSSALLSELSQLASSGQTFIQHNSGISAFHKCSSSTQRRADCNTGSTEADGIVKHSDPSLGQSYGLHVVETFSGLIEDLEDAKKEIVEAGCDARVSEGVLQIQGVRKRKASNCQDNQHEDKKRLNSLRHQKKNEANDDDVFIVKFEDSLASKLINESLDATESHIAEKSQSVDYMYASKSGSAHKAAQCEDNLVGTVTSESHDDPQKTLMDTETLLGMIEDSKSMTVKETIRALNELRAKHLQNGNRSYSTAGIDVSVHRERPTVQESISCQDVSLSSQAAAADSKHQLSGSNSNQGSVVASRSQSACCNSVSPFKLGHSSLYSAHQEAGGSPYATVHKVERTGRRHISLNLESLESDALLDTEPALDHRLVGDIRDITSARSDQKTSIGVAVKSTKPKSLRLLLDRSSDNKNRPKQPRQDIRSSKATLLNDKNHLDKVFSNISKKESDSCFLSDKTNDHRHAELQVCSKERKQSAKNSRKNAVEMSPALGGEQRRSMSCINDIIGGNHKPSFTSCTSAMADTNISVSNCQRVKTPSLTNLRQAGESNASEHPVLAHFLSVPSAARLEVKAEAYDRLTTDSLHPSTEQPDADTVVDKSDFSENELPGDIADFITESMSAGHAYSCSAFRGNSLTTLLADLVRNGQSDREQVFTQDGQYPTIWRSVSVPNTITDTYYKSTSENIQSCHEISSESMPVSYVRSWSTASIAVNPNIADQQLQPVGCKDVSKDAWEGTPNSAEASHSLGLHSELGKVKDMSTDHSTQPADGYVPLSSGTFLSPVGPAKLTRRSSVERSSSGDRTLTKTPVEVLAHKFIADKSLPRIRTPTDRMLVKAPVDRFHAKTPIDKSLHVTSTDKVATRISREKSPSIINNSSRDHTAAAVNNSSRDHTAAAVNNSSRDHTAAAVNNSSRDHTAAAVNNSSRDHTAAAVNNSCRDHTAAAVNNSSRDHTAAAALQQPVKETDPVKERDPHRQPVNRVLAKSPAEKVLGNFVYESHFTNRSFDRVTHSSLADGVQEDRSHNQTPVSDAGYSSVSQTPLSDVGYSSPSPVMMSLPGLFGECGRQELTSPATIFMPVRSDSVLSMVNNNGRGGDGADIGLTLQAGSQGGSMSVLDRCLHRTSKVDDYDKTDREQSLFNQDFIGHESSLLQDAIDGALLNDGLIKSNAQLNMIRASDSHIFRDSSLFNDVAKFMSVQLNCIPTPPHSPSTSPQHLADTSQSPLSFNVSASQSLPPTHSHHSLLAPVCSTSSRQVTQFSSLATISSHVSCLSSNNLPHISSSPGFCSSAGQQSPNAPPEYSRSPYNMTHPCSSPHQYNPHPSPPFTPSSQRCLASPRCPTPCSHRSLMSPRCATPCGDSNSAPNRFMPIQTSGILTTPLTTTQTYIQPIRPVVTLASVANQNHRSSLDLSKLEHFARLPMNKNIPRLTETSILDLLRRDINDHNTFQQPTKANVDVPSGTDKLKIITLSVDCDTAPYHRKVQTRQRAHEDHKSERSGHPSFILSLTGGIGSVSRQGMQAGWVHNIPDPASPSSLTKVGHGRSVPSYHPQPTHCAKPKSARAHPETDQRKSTEFHEVSKPHDSSLFESGDKTNSSSPQIMTTNITSAYSTRANLGENVYNLDSNLNSPAIVGISNKSEKEQTRISHSKASNKLLLSNKNLNTSIQRENEQLHSGHLNYPSPCSSDFQLSLQLAKHSDQSESSYKEHHSQVQDNRGEGCGPSQLSFQRLGHESRQMDSSRKSSLTTMLQAPAFTAGHILHTEGKSSNTDNIKPKSCHQISDLPSAHYSGTAPNVDLTKASFALSTLPTGLTPRSDSGITSNVEMTKASFALASLPSSLTDVASAQHSRPNNTPDVYFINLNTSRQTDDSAPGNQDELDETLSILKSLDSQYFQQDEGSSSPKGSG